ncbi:MAG: CBS domain-containing protein [Gammaproteobacteria bacterium]|nr:CBS domain-containing protein [Gammaproteobacteria bacterium]NIR82863.1 CBS domain-containing protein [Gammaproteobacteria bacterium]NIR89972.1 CBS domain-containing protein [Gammaproteobacteria bacterium]NIU04021.1 CBS domain-containing protein [Gammaproteobacteria bacterium]NIV51341.1 CBS domain-containing protein [Gammaproteobacteria bacterium]
MKTEFAPLSNVRLQPGTTYRHPPELPEIVHLDDPATDVMTDFEFVKPVTVRSDVPIDEALELMMRAGVRLLLVTDDAGAIIGLITARDIMGERPIKLAQEARVLRSSIRVDQIMAAQPEITGLNMVSVRNARVGHIVETLRRLERQHVLVLEVDALTKKQCVRGLFSTSQIGRQLGVDLTQEVVPAHSLAEIRQERG